MLEGKVVLIIGAAGTLGNRFSQEVAAAGAVVCAADKDVVKARNLASQLCSRYGRGRALGAPVDITRAATIDRALERAKAKFGKVDAVVVCAYPRNSSYGTDALEVTYENFCGNVDMHLGGYFLSMQRAARFFAEQGWGNIVTLSSIYGLLAPRFDLYAGTKISMPVEYAAIKSGLIHLTRYFAKRLAGSKVRVNCISPGGILDGQDEKFLSRYRRYCLNKGMLEGKDVAGTLLFLLSDSSTYVNGQNLVVDDGFTL